MSVTTSAADVEPDPEQVETIQAISEGDLLVINGDTRTWEVTDIVERTIDESGDTRERKRVCRLSSTNAVFALELVTYSESHEARVHVLKTDDWTETDQTYPVESIRILDHQVPWVVVSSGTDTYHFPDPQAAGFGEAAPACGGAPQTSEYRITRLNMVYPAYSVCKDCARHAKPVALEPVTCPDCGKLICDGVFQRVEAGAVQGVVIACSRCGFEGTAAVNTQVRK